jgi:hypothetical protein
LRLPRIGRPVARSGGSPCDIGVPPEAEGAGAC